MVLDAFQQSRSPSMSLVVDSDSIAKTIKCIQEQSIISNERERCFHVRVFEVQLQLSGLNVLFVSVGRKSL